MRYRLRPLKRDVTPRERKFLAVGLIVLPFCLIYWWLAPKFDELNRKRDTLLASERHLIQEEKVRMEDEVLGKILQDRALLLDKIPNENPAADIIVKLERWCDQDQVDLLSISFSDSNRENSLPTAIHLKGPLPGLFKVLEQLEALPMVFELDNMILSTPSYAGGTRAQVSEKWELELNITLFFYEGDLTPLEAY